MLHFPHLISPHISLCALFWTARICLTPFPHCTHAFRLCKSQHSPPRCSPCHFLCHNGSCLLSASTSLIQPDVLRPFPESASACRSTCTCPATPPRPPFFVCRTSDMKSWASETSTLLPARAAAAQFAHRRQSMTITPRDHNDRRLRGHTAAQKDYTVAGAQAQVLLIVGYYSASLRLHVLLNTEFQMSFVK